MNSLGYPPGGNVTKRRLRHRLCRPVYNPRQGQVCVGKYHLVDVVPLPRIIDYTDPYDVEYACFMLLKPPPLPQWQALTMPLQPPVSAQPLNLSNLFYVLTISLHLPIIHYNLVQVWLATLLSFVVVTVAYALLTRHSWSTDPSFAFVDSKCSYNLCHHCC